MDEFILFDDVQYTRRDWRNRNRIKTPRGAQWLSIPVKVAGRYLQTIRDTEIDAAGWPRAHWTAIAQNYAAAPAFRQHGPFLEELYRGTTATRLSDVNERFLRAICGLLGIETAITRSMDYELVAGKTERLIHLCRQSGASEYVSGPSARRYLDVGAFSEAGIAVRFIDYDGYPEYPQLHGAFDHHVSIIDLILNLGPAATAHMKSFARR